uniref:Glutamyl-tRNA(Gln) amidotransferase subunit C, mitochondrial n=1 Tax=Parastrongyloides trichosuri TaxID=131310 RepID=A0A0N4ZYB9_PARTI
MLLFNKNIIFIRNIYKNFLPKNVYHMKIKYNEKDAVTKIDKDLLNHLEQISLLRFTKNDIENLKEDIFLANAIFTIEDKTKGVEPLYSVMDDVINCPLREDIPEDCSKDIILQNTQNSLDDYFVSPQPNTPLVVKH